MKYTLVKLVYYRHSEIDYCSYQNSNEIGPAFGNNNNRSLKKKKRYTFKRGHQTACPPGIWAPLALVTRDLNLKTGISGLHCIHWEVWLNVHIRKVKRTSSLGIFFPTVSEKFVVLLHFLHLLCDFKRVDGHTPASNLSNTNTWLHWQKKQETLEYAEGFSLLTNASWLFFSFAAVSSFLGLKNT